MPVAGDVRERVPGRCAGLAGRPRRSRPRWRGSPRQAAGGSRRAGPGGRRLAAGASDRRLGTGGRPGGRQPAPGGPGTRRLAVGDELDAGASGEPAQGMLVAFEHHDVDIGVVTRDVSCGQVDGPASCDPPGNGQARQQRATACTSSTPALWVLFNRECLQARRRNVPLGLVQRPRRCCWRAVRP